MPYEIPKPLTGRTEEDIRTIWEAVFRLVEQLRLEEDRRAAEERSGRT